MQRIEKGVGQQVGDITIGIEKSGCFIVTRLSIQSNIV